MRSFTGGCGGPFLPLLVRSRELILTDSLCVCACVLDIEGSRILKMLRLNGWTGGIGMRYGED